MQTTILLHPHGGYRSLKSYQTAEIILDGTVRFCERFLEKNSRTNDQMVQAARSGKQNIAEASQASGTSRGTELRLTNVARASLEELLLDYEDFLRQRHLLCWVKDDIRTQSLRKLVYEANRSYATYQEKIENADPETSANTLIVLIHQACFLLDRQLQYLERQYREQGGFREAMYKSRTQNQK